MGEIMQVSDWVKKDYEQQYDETLRLGSILREQANARLKQEQEEKEKEDGIPDDNNGS